MRTEQYLTTEQVAELFNFSPRTLEGMRCKGTGPAFCKLGRKCLYRLSDLEKWAESRTYNSTSEIDVDKRVKAKSSEGNTDNTKNQIILSSPEISDGKLQIEKHVQSKLKIRLRKLREKKNVSSSDSTNEVNDDEII